MKAIIDSARRTIGRVPPRLTRIGPLLALAAALLALGAGYQAFEAPYATDADRFGVGLAESADRIVDYDLEALGASWYLNWGASMDPPHPNGAPFMQTIRLDEGDPVLSDQQVINLVQANPGATWQIGNEPDSIFLDDTEPEAYATAYHHLYHLIKGADATARVANGGLVQATPLRMLYLDRVWESYQDQFTVTMPVDIWIVHGFILRERDQDWGAWIPPGMGDQADEGMLYDIRDHDDLTIFAEQIERFRQWMADHGQRDKPLIVNEYGILMWSDIEDEDGEDFSDDRVITFMHGTFDYFLTAADPLIGYPADGDRLVQAWAWYSLDDNRYEDGEIVGEGYNGDLFTGQYTKTMTALGRGHGTYVVGDVRPESLVVAPTVAPIPGPEGITVTVSADVTREGGLNPVEAVSVTLSAVGPGFDDVHTIPLGTMDDGDQVPISSTYTLTETGLYTVAVHVDPADQVIEVDEANNVAQGTVLLPSTQVFLPLALRGQN